MNEEEEEEEEEDGFPKHHGSGYHRMLDTSNHPTNMDLMVAPMPHANPKTTGPDRTPHSRKPPTSHGIDVARPTDAPRTTSS